MYKQAEQKETDYMLLVDTAVLAGEIMLESGAEAYRVEDTISHFLRTANLKHAQVFVTMTGIIATLSDPSIEAITVVRRVSKRSTNLNKIYLVNDVSRKFSGNEIELKDAFHELKQIRQREQYSIKVKSFGIVLTSAFFCMLLGGNLYETAIAAVIGTLLSFLIWAGRKIGLQGFLLDGVNTLLVVFAAMVIGYFIELPVRTDMIIIGGIMPMVPGVAITNAIRDTLQGDYVSGGARMMEACMEAGAIAFGACVGIFLFNRVI